MYQLSVINQYGKEELLSLEDESPQLALKQAREVYFIVKLLSLKEL